jgi:hypothetical protein
MFMMMKGLEIRDGNRVEESAYSNIILGIKD